MIERFSASRIQLCGARIREDIANGTQLGWLIDLFNRSVTIFRPNRDPQTYTGITSIAGEEPVNGFVPDLTEV